MLMAHQKQNLRRRDELSALQLMMNQGQNLGEVDLENGNRDQMRRLLNQSLCPSTYLLCRSTIGSKVLKITDLHQGGAKMIIIFRWLT